MINLALRRIFSTGFLGLRILCLGLFVPGVSEKKDCMAGERTDREGLGIARRQQ